MARDRGSARSWGDSGGDGMGDHAEGNDVGEGGGINPASISIARCSGSFWSCFATRAVAILHSFGRGGADAGTGAGAGLGVGAVVGSGGVAFGGGAARAPGGNPECCLWSGVIVDSTVKPPLVWPGEGTKR